MGCIFGRSVINITNLKRYLICLNLLMKKGLSGCKFFKLSVFEVRNKKCASPQNSTLILIMPHLRDFFFIFCGYYLRALYMCTEF